MVAFILYLSRLPRQVHDPQKIYIFISAIVVQNTCVPEQVVRKKKNKCTEYFCALRK